MLNNYLLYLKYMTDKIQKYFDEQREYICCRQGCSKCCKKAQFPYSEIEFKLIYEGLISLKPEIQVQVLNKVDETIIAKQKHLEEHPNEKFRYDCPFLINDECSVYYYRGFICRTFGLMTFLPESKQTPNIPFCAFEGLNYSKVLDDEGKKISDIKYNQHLYKQEPLAYNIDYKTLINEEAAQAFGFKFGDVKPLIDWFILWKEQAINRANSNQ